MLPAAPPPDASSAHGIEIYFEDFREGQHFDLGSAEISEAEMLEFARHYDPQPFHVDPERARQTVFKGLIASGWQTAGIWMRLYCEGLLLRSASLGSPGVESLRWLAPVRPGDRLTATADVLGVRGSATNPGRGTVIVAGELAGGDGLPRMRLRAWGHFARRAPSPGG